MLKIAHRVNTTDLLLKIPRKYGVEIDLRAYKDKVVLSHDPYVKGELFENYIKYFSHSFAVINIKETGIEEKVLELVRDAGIKNFFLLDVEFPYIYKAAREGLRNIAMRYSEDESIATVLKYKGMVDWVWIDCQTKLPININVMEKLEGFRTCLVSPDRWGRPEDIVNYKAKLSSLNFWPDAVMAGYKYLDLW